jgi:hypothetical protein
MLHYVIISLNWKEKGKDTVYPFCRMPCWCYWEVQIVLRMAVHVKQNPVNLPAQTIKIFLIY